MTVNGWVQIFVFLALIFAVTKPLGSFLARVFAGERTVLDPVLRPVERVIYRVTGVDDKHEMRWTEYATAMLLFSLVSMVLLYLIQRMQQWLPFNPQHFAGVTPEHLAFNTAASFTTNTNWQAYAGETTMSYLTQMAGLAFHNFTSAATGIVLAIAFIRGIARRQMQTLGNFWVDFTRCCLWVLLPFCVVGALFLVSQGVVQNLRPYDTVNWLSRSRCNVLVRMESRWSIKTASRSWIRSQPRQSHRGRSPRRKLSRNSAPMGAASSMPIARIRLRILLR
jgi:potassium-transporting ATPase potassium-binding subunit